MKKSILLSLATIILLAPSSSYGMMVNPRGGDHCHFSWSESNSERLKTHYVPPLNSKLRDTLLSNNPDLQAAKKLLKKGAELDGIVNGCGDTILNLAADQKKYLESIMFLLENKAQVNVKNSNKRTPLSKNLDDIKFYVDLWLIRKNRDYEVKYKEHLVRAKLFIEHGANLSLAYDKEKNPISSIYTMLADKQDKQPINLLTEKFIYDSGKYYINRDQLDQLETMLTLLDQCYKKDDNQTRKTAYAKIRKTLQQLTFIRKIRKAAFRRLESTLSILYSTKQPAGRTME